MERATKDLHDEFDAALQDARVIPTTMDQFRAKTLLAELDKTAGAISRRAVVAKWLAAAARRGTKEP